MAIPKKGSRTITVNDHTYRYKVTGNDFVIDLAIESDESQGQLMSVGFLYTNSITPGVVRKVIEYGLEKGWTPTKRAKNFTVNGYNIDDLDDIDLWGD